MEAIEKKAPAPSQVLDINSNRVVEWLLERRKLSTDWNSKLRAIALRQKELLQVLQQASESHLRAATTEDSSGFIQAKLILSRLEVSPESLSGRSILGNWQSPHLHNWTRLIQLYEKNNLYLADCGKQLLQLGGYDLSALKQQLSQYEKQLQDGNQKEQAILESEERMKKAYKEQCQKLNIPGVKPRQELKALTRQLPELFFRVHAMLLSPEMTTAINQYKEITHSNHGSIVELPALEELRAMGELKVDIEALKNSYAPVVTADVEIDEEAEEPEAGTEWAIEMLSAGDATAAVSDLPYSDRTLRNRLQTDLEELNAFFETRSTPQTTITDVLFVFKSALPLLLMREQPTVIEMTLRKLEDLQRDRVSGQLQTLHKQASEIRASSRQVMEQIHSLKTLCRRLIGVLEEGIPTLFPGFQVKIIGELLRDLAQSD